MSGAVLLGGAFDPPHLGHVALADAARTRFAPRRLAVLVSERPGHKGVHAPAADRLALARLAFPGDEVVLDPHARTVDLLRAGPWRDPVFVVGADQLAAFPAWKEPEAVLELATLAVATRPGYPRERLEAVLASLARPERVVLFEIPAVAIASRDVRAKLAAGEDVRDLVPPAVAREIERRGLYR